MNSVNTWYFVRYRCVVFFRRFLLWEIFEISCDSVFVDFFFFCLLIQSHWGFKFSTNDTEWVLIFLLRCSCAGRHLNLSCWQYGWDSDLKYQNIFKFKNRLEGVFFKLKESLQQKFPDWAPIVKLLLQFNRLSGVFLQTNRSFLWMRHVGRGCREEGGITSVWCVLEFCCLTYSALCYCSFYSTDILLKMLAEVCF